MLYSANICTVTKPNDMFEMVAVNKYPIFVECANDDDFFEMLKKDDINTFISNNLKTLFLFNNAKMCVRAINERTDEHYEFEFDIKDRFTFKKNINTNINIR